MGFEPTCPSLDKTISSRSRYDHFDTSPYLIFKHRLARYLEKCKISMQDNKGKFRCAPEEKPAIKPFLADKLTKGRESFESRLFDHLSTAPYSPAHKRAILYYNRFGGPRQRETRSKRGGRAKGRAPACAAPATQAGRPGGAGERPLFSLRLSGRALPFSPPRAGVTGPFAVQSFAAGGSLPSARSWRVMPSK